jgi:hypothetical protein
MVVNLIGKEVGITGCSFVLSYLSLRLKKQLAQ